MGGTGLGGAAMLLPGVSLKAKIVGLGVLVILTFSFVGAVLETVKDIQAAESAPQPLLREQFAAAGWDYNSAGGSDNLVLASLKYACPFH